MNLAGECRQLPLVQPSLHRLELSAERLDIGTFVQQRFPHRLFSEELLAQLFKRLATFFDGDGGRITNLSDRIAVARVRDSAL